VPLGKAASLLSLKGNGATWDTLMSTWSPEPVVGVRKAWRWHFLALKGTLRKTKNRDNDEARKKGCKPLGLGTCAGERSKQDAARDTHKEK